jgi:hypothetical protein
MQQITKYVGIVMAFLLVGAVGGLGVPTTTGIQRPVEPPRELPPSPFEAFATCPTAEVVWSKLVGQLESPAARATVTALIVEDATSPPGAEGAAD